MTISVQTVFIIILIMIVTIMLVGRQGIEEILTVCGAAFGGYMLGTTIALALLAKEKPLELLTSE